MEGRIVKCVIIIGGGRRLAEGPWRLAAFAAPVGASDTSPSVGSGAAEIVT